ncbi:MAG: hypothetical protein HYS22_02050 [Deltaproteobacteria bacterium]|nr:hypothetical protein [Deltaproteobacteria bacterium]
MKRFLLRSPLLIILGLVPLYGGSAFSQMISPGARVNSSSSSATRVGSSGMRINQAAPPVATSNSRPSVTVSGATTASGATTLKLLGNTNRTNTDKVQSSQGEIRINTVTSSTPATGMTIRDIPAANIVTTTPPPTPSAIVIPGGATMAAPGSVLVPPTVTIPAGGGATTVIIPPSVTSTIQNIPAANIVTTAPPASGVAAGAINVNGSIVDRITEGVGNIFNTVVDTVADFLTSGDNRISDIVTTVNTGGTTTTPPPASTGGAIYEGGGRNFLIETGGTTMAGGTGGGTTTTGGGSGGVSTTTPPPVCTGSPGDPPACHAQGADSQPTSQPTCDTAYPETCAPASQPTSMPVGSFCVGGAPPVFQETLVTSGQGIDQVAVHEGVWVDGIPSQGSISWFRINPEGLFQAYRGMTATSGPVGSTQTEADIHLFTLGDFLQNDPEIDLLTMTPYYLFSAFSPEYNFSPQNFPSVTSHPAFMTGLEIGDAGESEYAAAWESGTVLVGRVPHPGGSEQPKTMTLLSQNNDKIYDFAKMSVSGAGGDFLITLTRNLQNQKVQLIYVGTGPHFFQGEPVSRFLEIDTVGTPRRMAVTGSRVVVVTNDNTTRKSYLYTVPISYSPAEDRLLKGEVSSLEIPGGVGFVAVADLNRDGRDDLVLYVVDPTTSASNSTGSIQIFYPDSSGVFRSDQVLSHPVPAGKIVRDLDAGPVGSGIGIGYLTGGATAVASRFSGSGGDYRVESTDTVAVPPTLEVSFLQVSCPGGSAGGTVPGPYGETTLPPPPPASVLPPPLKDQVITLEPIKKSCIQGEEVTIAIPVDKVDNPELKALAIKKDAVIDSTLTQMSGPYLGEIDRTREWKLEAVPQEGRVLAAKVRSQDFKSALSAFGTMGEDGALVVKTKSSEVTPSDPFEVKITCGLVPMNAKEPTYVADLVYTAKLPDGTSLIQPIQLDAELMKLGGGGGCSLIPEQ